MTIADVECKHALSQHWSDKPFATIVSKHLNQEFKVLKSEALSLARDQLKQQKQLVSETPQPRKPELVDVILQKKQIRKKAAIHFFRDDYLKGELKSAPGSSINPISKDFWQGVKAAWNSLNAEQRKYYEELSVQSGFEAEQKRQKHKVDQSNASQSQMVRNQNMKSDVAVHPSQHNHLVAWDPWLLPASDLEKHNTFQLLEREVDEARQALIACAPGLLGDDVHAVSPVSEEMLEKAWRSNLAKGITWQDSLSQFDQETQRFASPEPGMEFPQKVTYQGHCGNLCRTCSSHNDIALFVKLKDSFVAALKSLGQISDVAKTPILFQVDAVFDQDGTREIFAWMVAPSAASGVYPAEQVFVLCERGEQIDTDCFFLELKLHSAGHSKELECHFRKHFVQDFVCLVLCVSFAMFHAGRVDG